ncbi:MAG: hypothetical protein IKO25_01635 [Clostridia bacterium]|nr:hypothetical protein [Clostridia bacterium]
MGDQLKSLNTRVPETQKKALDEFCQAHNISRQDVVTQAIDAFFSSTADKYPTYAGDIELVKECTETIFEKYVNAIHSLETARTLGSAEQRKAVDVLSTSNDELRQQLSAARTETETLKKKNSDLVNELAMARRSAEIAQSESQLIKDQKILLDQATSRLEILEEENRKLSCENNDYRNRLDNAKDEIISTMRTYAGHAIDHLASSQPCEHV